MWVCVHVCWNRSPWHYLAFLVVAYPKHNLYGITGKYKCKFSMKIVKRMSNLNSLFPCENDFNYLVFSVQGTPNSTGTRNFFVGGIEGAKCDSEGVKIQKFAENGWFWPYFSSDGGQVGGQSLWLGENAPHAPSPWCRHWLRSCLPTSGQSSWFSSRFTPNSHELGATFDTELSWKPGICFFFVLFLHKNLLLWDFYQLVLQL